MLRKTRIVLSALFFIGITLLFLGIGDSWWGWMTHLQFLPSVMRVIVSASALNIGVLAFLILLTLLFGRIYCSVICPLGILQDVALRVRNLIGRKKVFKFSRENKVARYGFLVLTVSSMIAGLQVFVALIAPYSAYGRIVSSICGLGKDTPLALLAVGLLTFVLIVALSVLYGRAWCNTVCPVGTFLGLISRFSLFKLRIDESKCVKCGACGKKCKASCIDVENGKVDASRCVGCFDCLDSCHVGAISFKAGCPSKAESGSGVSRRAFIATAVVLGTGVAAKAAEETQGGLAPVKPKTEPGRKGVLLPPGAWSLREFSKACTSCQLCISACPNKVLHPSTSLESLLQPRMGFTLGWCRPECNECSAVCPTGAIRPIERDEKTVIKIGTARVEPKDCISCGNCVRKCPSGALKMTTVDDKRIPVVAEEHCIGCGRCEYVCPVRPKSAIMVDGLEKHVRV